MKLLTKEILEKFPKIYETDGNDEAKAIVKFFTPDAQATWHAFEFDGEDTFFGHADLFGDGGEFGYFSLSELQSLRGRMGLPVERDRYAEMPTKRELMK